MFNMMQFLVLASVLCPPTTAPVAADVQKRSVRVEAVVRKFEPNAREDLFDDDRFAVYDAVTFHLVSPSQLAEKKIRLFFPSASVADDSPLRKAGVRCRFDVDIARLKSDQLFSGVLENLRWTSRQSLSSADCQSPNRGVR